MYCSVCNHNNPVIDCYLGEYPKQPITDCGRCEKLIKAEDVESGADQGKLLILAGDGVYPEVNPLK